MPELCRVFRMCVQGGTEGQKNAVIRKVADGTDVAALCVTRPLLPHEPPASKCWLVPCHPNRRWALLAGGCVPTDTEGF